MLLGSGLIGLASVAPQVARLDLGRRGVFPVTTIKNEDGRQFGFVLSLFYLFPCAWCIVQAGLPCVELAEGLSLLWKFRCVPFPTKDVGG